MPMQADGGMEMALDFDIIKINVMLHNISVSDREN